MLDYCAIKTEMLGLNTNFNPTMNGLDGMILLEPKENEFFHYIKYLLEKKQSEKLINNLVCCNFQQENTETNENKEEVIFDRENYFYNFFYDNTYFCSNLEIEKQVYYRKRK